MFPVAILAGGLATRLRPITEKIPKALLEIAGRPFIYSQLQLLQRQGITQVVLCVGYLGERIQAAVGDGAAFGLSVRYSFDGPALLGTGGALKRALPALGERFFVLYGDSYLLCSFADIQASFERNAASALMTVFHNGDLWDKSNVLFEGGRVLEYNKRSPKPVMQHIDYGLGILSARIFDAVPDGAFDLADIYHELSLRGQLSGFEVEQRFYEIGSSQGIAATEQYLESKAAEK